MAHQVDQLQLLQSSFMQHVDIKIYGRNINQALALALSAW